MGFDWDKSMTFPTFKFDFDQLSTWAFWKEWLCELIGSTLFMVTCTAMGGNAWAFGFSYLIWTTVMGCTILSSVTFKDTMDDKNFVRGIMWLIAQGLACNLGNCSEFLKIFGAKSQDAVTALEFTELIGGAAIFEWLTVFVYFFLLTKGNDSDFPKWLFTSMLVAGAFWMNANTIFTPSRIWTIGDNLTFSNVFASYLNNFLGVYFGINVSNYLFADWLDQKLGN